MWCTSGKVHVDEPICYHHMLIFIIYGEGGALVDTRTIRHTYIVDNNSTNLWVWIDQLSHGVLILDEVCDDVWQEYLSPYYGMSASGVEEGWGGGYSGFRMLLHYPCNIHRTEEHNPPTHVPGFIMVSIQGQGEWHQIINIGGELWNFLCHPTEICEFLMDDLF